MPLEILTIAPGRAEGTIVQNNEYYGAGSFYAVPCKKKILCGSATLRI
jgi:hypothetical protein